MLDYIKENYKDLVKEGLFVPKLLALMCLVYGELPSVLQTYLLVATFQPSDDSLMRLKVSIENLSLSQSFKFHMWNSTILSWNFTCRTYTLWKWLFFKKNLKNMYCLFLQKKKTDFPPGVWYPYWSSMKFTFSQKSLGVKRSFSKTIPSRVTQFF